RRWPRKTKRTRPTAAGCAATWTGWRASPRRTREPRALINCTRASPCPRSSSVWIEDFRKSVEAHPDWVAVVDEGRRYTYRELWDRSAAAGLAACQAQPGTRHWIAVAEGLGCIEAVVGAWIHGKVPVVVPPDMPAEVQAKLRQRIHHPPPPQ